MSLFKAKSGTISNDMPLFLFIFVMRFRVFVSFFPFESLQ